MSDGVFGHRVGVFSADETDLLASFYLRYGFAILRGAFDGEVLDQLSDECVTAQRALLSGALDERYGTAALIEGDAGAKAARFANYVLHITELSPAARRLLCGREVVGIIDLLFSDGCWSSESDLFGFVYQDARPSPDSSYKRIGWHSDWQSSPHLDIWPAAAVTVHIDGTGPDNGFLRVVPGSHLWATPPPHENVNGVVVPPRSAPWGGRSSTPAPVAMPLRFEKIPGEVGIYAEPGDVLFHDCYLWHSAAMATEIESRRRHVRGSWYAGARPPSFDADDFVKNAAR